MSYLLTLLLLMLSVPSASAQDRDRDGLDDHFEQSLLERFIPTFYLSAGECDALPAAFAPGTLYPVVAARNGTIHGRAFPAPDGGVELQFFHLWARDCGRGGHALDAEHVSALLEPAPDGAWAARLWYAAAHEDTFCDHSTGARAATLGAVSAGPRVYVSRGKHASYLDQGQCSRGCGTDACPMGQPLAVAALVNIGEPGTPLNGATWMASSRWPLGSKLQSDFDPAVRARLDRREAVSVIALSSHMRAPQAPVLAGDTALDGIIHAGGGTVKGLAMTTSRLARIVAIARRAQYPGWLVPDGGREEKSPMASAAGAAARGKDLYAANCARCHGPSGKGDGPAATYAADLTDDLRTELNTEGVLFYKVWNGRIKLGKGATEDMPAFQGRLMKDEVWAIVEYLKILRTPRP